MSLVDVWMVKEVGEGDGNRNSPLKLTLVAEGEILRVHIPE